MDGLELAIRIGMTGVGLAATATDLRARRIPNWLTLPAVIGIGIGRWVQGRGGEALAGAAVAAAVFLLPVFLFGTERAGAGDLKLGIAMGLAIGFPRIIEALLLAFGAMTAVGGGLWIARRLPPDRTFPMAPGLALGILWGLWLT